MSGMDLRMVSARDLAAAFALLCFAAGMGALADALARFV